MSTRFKLSSTIRCDVLIIGAGGAGLRCAAHILEKRPGTRIVAVTKVSHPQKSHTSTAQGGLAAVDPHDPVDKPIYHMFDTWKGSDCMADQTVVQKIVDAAWEEIVWLENKGMHFTRDEEGRLSKRTFGGHTVRFGEASAFRAVFEADRTGKGIMDNVWGEALRGGVTFLDQTLLTELLIQNEQCVGGVLFKEKPGEFVAVSAKATVLATGGCGQVFRVTTNCRQNTGDAHAVVLQAGLPLMDMEAVQFHPTGIVGPGILASETLRSVGGILRNKELEPFMVRYAPKMKELAPRDLVARAIETEIREGRGILNPDHHIEHVWIDLRHLSDYVHEVQIPEVSGFFKQFMNLDPRKQLCPVRPSNHYQMGGIPTNAFGEVQPTPGTILSGLYAVGECGCASFHGFNRLGTNSILELITMGRFVGERVLQSLSETAGRLPTDAGDRTFAQFAGYLESTKKENLDQIPKRYGA
jgi:succinate dehydrogenase / fumarate reductase flavoprotein subunit